MPTNYWIVINIAAHATHPVTHHDRITLKSYFDENPEDLSDRITTSEQSSYSVPSEHSSPFPNTTDDVQAYHMISQAEFIAPNYRYYVWAEPYGSAAFQTEGHRDFYDLSVGRTNLYPGLEKYRGPASRITSRPNGIRENDMVIEYDLKISNSIVQFIVDEMNTNRRSAYVYRQRFANGGMGQVVVDGINLIDTFRQFHTDSGRQGEIQDFIFRGAGIGIINPVFNLFGDNFKD